MHSANGDLVANYILGCVKAEDGFFRGEIERFLLCAELKSHMKQIAKDWRLNDDDRRFIFHHLMIIMKNVELSDDEINDINEYVRSEVEKDVWENQVWVIEIKNISYEAECLKRDGWFLLQEMAFESYDDAKVFVKSRIGNPKEISESSRIYYELEIGYAYRITSLPVIGL